MTTNYSSEHTCELYGNGKTLAIKHNLSGETTAMVLKNLHLVSYDMSFPSRNIDFIPQLVGDRMISIKPPGIVTINMEFKMLETDMTQMYNSKGDINIMFKQETEKLLEQAYKQIKARAKPKTL